MIENAHRTFWTYWLIGVGSLGLITFLVVCWDGICDTVEDLFSLFKEDDLDDDEGYYAEDDLDEEEHYSYKPARRRKSLKWKIFIPFLSHQRRKWLEKRDGHRADRKCQDILAETLTTYEDILKAMDGEAPSMGEIYQQVKDQYWN